MSCSATRLARRCGTSVHWCVERSNETLPYARTVAGKLSALTCLVALYTLPTMALANSALNPPATSAPSSANALVLPHAPTPTSTQKNKPNAASQSTTRPPATNEAAPTVTPPVPQQDPVALLYAHTSKPLLWSAFDAPREVAFEAIEALAASHEHGLDPARYATDTLYRLITDLTTAEPTTDSKLAEFDKLLTAAIWTLNEDLRRGKEPPVPRDGIRPPVADDVITDLARAIEQGTLTTHLNSHIPQFASYQTLRHALETYRDYELMGGWTPLPNDTRLIPGDEHPSIPALRQRLVLTDGLSDTALSSELFDAPLQAAVMRFQQRHQLQVDGHVGPATLAKLNISVTEKLRWLSNNLARLRALPPQLPNDRLQVNIPEFQLRLYTDNTETLTMGVVVGNKRNPTPSMQDRLRHLVFNPYWYPTRRITRNEILPRLKRDPDYLQHANFEMIERQSKKVVDAGKIDWTQVDPRTFPYRFRQIPGETNSLGQVKFIFPNKQSIYLHDTPSRKLFSERVRAFSHGCVRVEKPTELATHLMAWDRGWTKAEVHADIDAAKRKLRKFKREMDIYLLYQTVAVRNDEVNFYPDIYRRDRTAQASNPLAPMVAASLPVDAPTTPNSRALAKR